MGQEFLTPTRCRTTQKGAVLIYFAAEGWSHACHSKEVEVYAFLFSFILVYWWGNLDIFLKYNQQDATFSRCIYFYKLLYMFQAVPPPIIRSTKLYVQRKVLSNQYFCYRGWDGTPFHLIHGSSRQQYWFDNTWRCMYSFVLLTMGGGTAWNM